MIHLSDGSYRKLQVGGKKRSFGMLGFTYVNQNNRANKDSEIQRAARFARANGYYARVIPISKDRSMSPNSPGGAPRWGLFVASKPSRLPFNVVDYPRVGRKSEGFGSNYIDFGGNAGGSIQKSVRDHIIKDRFDGKYRFGPGVVGGKEYNDELFDIKTNDYEFGVDYGANSAVMIYNRKKTQFQKDALETELLNAIMTDDVMFSERNRVGSEWKLAGPNYPEINIWLRRQEEYDPTLNMRDNIIQIVGPNGWKQLEKAKKMTDAFREFAELNTLPFNEPNRVGSQIFDWHKNVYDTNKAMFGVDLRELKDYNPRYDQWINWAWDSFNAKTNIVERGRILNTLRRDLLTAKYSSDANQLDTNSIDESVVNYLKENNFRRGLKGKVDQSWRKIVNLPDPQNPQLANVQGKINWSGDQ